jgi:hypothetical protein
MELNTERFWELFPEGNIIHLTILEIVSTAGRGCVNIIELPNCRVFKGLNAKEIIKSVEELVSEEWLTEDSEEGTVKKTEKCERLIWTDGSFDNYGKETK